MAPTSDVIPVVHPRIDGRFLSRFFIDVARSSIHFHDSRAPDSAESVVRAAITEVFDTLTNTSTVRGRVSHARRADAHAVNGFASIRASRSRATWSISSLMLARR